MRVFRQLIYCIAIFISSVSIADAASYTAAPLPADFKFRNNNGAQLSGTRTFVPRTVDDFDLTTTLTITDRNGVVVSQYTSPNHTQDSAQAFGDAGHVVGTRGYYFLVQFPEGLLPIITFSHAFVLVNGEFTNLNTLLDTAFGTPSARVFRSAAHGVNSAGEVVGEFQTSSGQFGFVYRNGTVVNLGLLSSPEMSTANAINDFGQVTGTNGHALVYSDGAIEDLGFVNTSTPESAGLAINAAGHVVGTSTVLIEGTGPLPHAFLYEGGAMIDIGPGRSSSTARAINKTDVIVGQYAFTSQRAFVYRDGAMTDLNFLIDPSPSIGTLYDAIAVNDDETIVARAVVGNTTQLVLLTPTPLPAIDHAVFSFEDGRQGWNSNGEPIVFLTPALSQKFAGERSLAIQVQEAGFASVRVLNPSAHSGQTIVFHLYVSPDAHIDWVQPFAQEGEAGNWNWHGAWAPSEALQVGAWNTITLTVPNDATPLMAIGLEFFASQARGTVFLDSVDYSSIADPAEYNFEASTQGWQSSDASAAVATSSAQSFSGERSLEVTLNNATFASVSVTNPAAHAGQVVTFHIYVPAGAPMLSLQPFAQEGEAGNWAWHGAWTPAEGLQFGAWNDITVELPSNAQSLKAIGLEIATTAAYTGKIYVDSVSF